MLISMGSFGSQYEMVVMVIKIINSFVRKSHANAHGNGTSSKTCAFLHYFLLPLNTKFQVAKDDNINL